MPTIHIIAPPHTIPNEDYSLCAYTTKARLFPSVLKPFGWRTLLYANEGGDCEADEHVTILSAEQFEVLSKRKDRSEDHCTDVGNRELHDAFESAILPKLRARVRSNDIIGHLWGPRMAIFNALRDAHHVELTVGYSASPGLPFRVFETSAWMHWHYAKAGMDDGNNYRWVIPSPIDSDRWRFCAHPNDYALYFGRITPRKGMDTLVEIARRMPELPIRAYGPGDPSPWTKQAPPNLTFHGPVFGDERDEIVRRASCQLMPTTFVEPFGNSGVEGQLCGVPLIGVSYGAFQETIIEGVTGYRCHTLADWVKAIQLSFALDRHRIAESAQARYSKAVIGKQYDWALRQVADLSGRGWYSARSRKFAEPVKQRRIWLYLPWFGELPNYFQLYLDSLGRNANVLSVILLTDADLSGYRLPANLIPVERTLDEIRDYFADCLLDDVGAAEVTPEELVKQPHKLTDFKILYPTMLDHVGHEHGVTEDDFVGWGDCDLIYGRLADFLDLEDCHVVGGLFGHFTALRNIAEFKNLFRQVPNLLQMLVDDANHVIDEIAFRKVLLRFCSEPGQIARIERDFCDVIPECFFNLFPQRTADFFDSTHPERELRYIRVAPDGRLTVAYQDGSTRPAIYCHLQKRAMALLFPSVVAAEEGYYIGEHGFSLERPRAKSDATGAAA